jgi:uncharacterized membrane protein
MNYKNLKPTFASVLSIGGIVIGIPFGAYCMTLKGGASLAGVLVFGIVICLAIVLAIDRILASFYNPKKLSLIEIIFFTLVLIFYLINKD